MSGTPDESFCRKEVPVLGRDKVGKGYLSVIVKKVNLLNEKEMSLLREESDENCGGEK